VEWDFLRNQTILKNLILSSTRQHNLSGWRNTWISCARWSSTKR